MSVDRISTGVDAIDRELSGGLRPGTIVSLEAPAASQSDAIVNMLLSERESVYLTTLRSEAVVRDELERGGHELSDISIQSLGGSTPIDEAVRTIKQVDGQVNVIVDPLTPLERDAARNRHVSFLNALKTHLVNTGSIALLHCTDEHRPTLRETTLSVSDVVWRLELDTGGTSLENRLIIPKVRGESLPTDIVGVTLGADVAVDLSRDIA